MIDCSHILISVAINDSLTEKLIFIQNSDPEILLEEFVKELIRRQDLIYEEVQKTYLMEDVDSLPE